SYVAPPPGHRAQGNLHVRGSEHRRAEPYRFSRQPPYRALHSRVRLAARLRRACRRGSDSFATARHGLGNRSRRDPEHRRNVRLLFTRQSRQRRTGQADSDAARSRLYAESDAGMTSKLSRRIETLAAIEIAFVLVALIIGGALVGFGGYVRTLNN